MRMPRIVRDEQGAVLVEFGMVLPLFLLMFCALFDFALALLSLNSLSSAVREGGRYAAVIQDIGTDDTRIQGLTARSFNALTVRGTVDSADVRVTAPTAANGFQITVTIPSTAYAYIPVTPLPTLLGLSSIPMGRSATFKSEWFDP